MTEQRADEELIRQALEVLRPVRQGDRLFGDVGAAVRTVAGSTYVGVCIDTPSWGICAERSALAAMVTAGEYRIDTVVAVWRDEGTPDRRAFVLPPCGHCREFMRALDPANLDARVLLSRTAGAPLRDLLPQHGWPQEPLPRSFG